jgi:phosphatidylserine/phosphatidylglycerophosphate/cardiolipin synthase-like enzyme
MFNIFKKQTSSAIELVTSDLFDEKTFYIQFVSDIQNCRSEVIIESPFITSSRMKILLPIFARLINKGIKIYIITRNPREHNGKYVFESDREIQRLENSGIQVLLCDGNHHRKLAVIDREILWEGSLNILSQTKSREVMRRINSKQITTDMLNFLKLEQIFR